LGHVLPEKRTGLVVDVRLTTRVMH
jgi:hypothetical protein